MRVSLLYAYTANSILNFKSLARVLVFYTCLYFLEIEEDRRNSVSANKQEHNKERYNQKLLLVRRVVNTGLGASMNLIFYRNLRLTYSIVLNGCNQLSLR